jgi:hypothetical protein
LTTPSEKTRHRVLRVIPSVVSKVLLARAKGFVRLRTNEESSDDTAFGMGAAAVPQLV